MCSVQVCSDAVPKDKHKGDYTDILKFVNLVKNWDGNGCKQVVQGFCFAVKKFDGLAYDDKNH